MRVLIVNSNQERSPWPVPPLGACAVAASVREAGHDVRLLDLTFVTRTRSAVARAVDDFRPEVIGIGVRNIDNVDWQAPHFYLPRIKADVVDVCQAKGGCPIVIGGPAAYGLSWAVYGLGLLIAGREALYYMNVFNKWFARVMVEKMIGSPPISPEEAPEEIPEETKGEKDSAAD